MSLVAIEAAVTRNTPYDDLPQWLSVQEVAAYSGCTPWTVYQNVHAGRIPYRRIGPKVILIPKDFFHPDRAQMAVTQ